MKRYFILSVLIVSSLFSFSQTQLKIGHLNYDEILLALPERDSAQVILLKEKKEYENGYEELTVLYNKLVDEYQKGLTGYTAVTKKIKEDELLDKQKRMSEFEQNATTSLQKRNTELLKPIIDKIDKAINQFATENAFTYIFDLSKGSVVFTSTDSQNVTAQVLKLLKRN
jgi:outer membrane protein